MDRRYWEDQYSDKVAASIEGELDNKPGIGRIERLTHDNNKYLGVTISGSGRWVPIWKLEDNYSGSV